MSTDTSTRISPLLYSPPAPIPPPVGHQYAPVGFRLGPGAEKIEIGGHGLSKSKKWRDLQASPKIAFVVDDLASTDPWTSRGIVIRGSAELHQDGGEQRFGVGWDSAWFAVVPQRIISWGIEGPAFSESGRRTARSVTTE